MENKPVVSIIIPVFNTEKYIKRCIDSCINQSFYNIEIIVIDDNSTDTSISIIESIADTRIKIIKNKYNQGTFLARKEGVKSAIGKYILFLDSDDYILDNTISILLNSCDDEDIINFGIQHEPIVKYATLPKIHTKQLYGEQIVKEIIINHFNKSWLNLCGRMYKTEIVKDAISRLKFINKHLISSEDTILFFIICLISKTSTGIDKNLYMYCHNENSITRTKDTEKLMKQISDREYLKDALKYIKDDKGIASHKYFKKASRNIYNMLDYFICQSKKLINNNNDIIPAYIKYSIISMKYMPRWQTIVKLIIYLFSCGNKKT